MKVKVKNVDYIASIARGVVILIFGVFSFFAIKTFFEAFNGTIDSLMTFFAEQGILLIFGMVFFCFELVFIYYLIKSPQKFVATLIDKRIEQYKDKKITYMVFRVKQNTKNDYIPNKYECYTEGKNDFCVGKRYLIGVKEFNWKIKSVKEFETEKEEKNAKQSIPNISLTPIFIAILFIFCVGILFVMLYYMYNSKATYFNMSTCIVIFIGGSYYIYKYLKTENMNQETNTNKLQSNKNVLENIRILQSDNKKVSNLIVKQMIYQIFQYLIIWYGLWAFIILILSKGSFKNFLNIMGPGTLPIAIIEIVNIIKLCFFIHYDKRLIKKYNLNILEENQLKNIREFCIFRANKDTNIEKYFIVDSNNNLLYKVQKYGIFRKRYIITDQLDNKIGEIIRKVLDYGYIIRLIEEEPYYIRRKLQISYNYEIIGRSYKVEGDTQAIDNVIKNEKDDEIAYITANMKENNWAKLGNSKVEVLPCFENNQNIVFIALCITMGNFHHNQTSI